MSYELCLEKAGAKVLEFKKFGSYQGDWLAFVEYKGQKGIVQGSYGSCSGCDSFQSEFGYETEPTSKNGKFYKNEDTWDDDNLCTEKNTMSIDCRKLEMVIGLMKKKKSILNGL